MEGRIHTFTRLMTLFRLRLLLLREVSSRRRSPPMKHVCPFPSCERIGNLDLSF